MFNSLTETEYLTESEIVEHLDTIMSPTFQFKNWVELFIAGKVEKIDPIDEEEFNKHFPTIKADGMFRYMFYSFVAGMQVGEALEQMLDELEKSESPVYTETATATAK